MTGAICAYLFADAGIRVALVESRLVARGSTAASTALLMQEPDRDFADLAARFGRRAARQIWMALARATRDFTKAIRQLKLDVDLCTCDSVYFTLDPEKIKELRKEFDARKAAGLPGRWLSPAALYRKTGISAHAAIATPGNAQLNPVRACHGLLQAAGRAGRSDFRTVAGSQREGVETRSRGSDRRRGYHRTARHRRHWLCDTSEFRGLVGRFRMKDTFVIATRRLPERLRLQILRGATPARASGSRRVRPRQCRPWRGIPTVRTTTFDGPAMGGCSWEART